MTTQQNKLIELFSYENWKQNQAENQRKAKELAKFLEYPNNSWTAKQGEPCPDYIRRKYRYEAIQLPPEELGFSKELLADLEGASVIEPILIFGKRVKQIDWISQYRKQSFIAWQSGFNKKGVYHVSIFEFQEWLASGKMPNMASNDRCCFIATEHFIYHYEYILEELYYPIDGSEPEPPPYWYPKGGPFSLQP